MSLDVLKPRLTCLKSDHKIPKLKINVLSSLYPLNEPILLYSLRDTHKRVNCTACSNAETVS